MNNHQNPIFHQFENFLKTPLALLGVDLKNSKINKICHFANHPYLCKGLFEIIKFRLLFGIIGVLYWAEVKLVLENMVLASKRLRS